MCLDVSLRDAALAIIRVLQISCYCSQSFRDGHDGSLEKDRACTLHFWTHRHSGLAPQRHPALQHRLPGQRLEVEGGTRTWRSVSVSHAFDVRPPDGKPPGHKLLLVDTSLRPTFLILMTSESLCDPRYSTRHWWPRAL